MAELHSKRAIAQRQLDGTSGRTAAGAGDTARKARSLATQVGVNITVCSVLLMQFANGGESSLFGAQWEGHASGVTASGSLLKVQRVSRDLIARLGMGKGQEPGHTGRYK